MRRTLLMSVVAVVVVACAGCGAGPSFRPGVAEREPGPTSNRPPSSAAATPPPPAPQVPRTPLPWTDCTRRTLSGSGLGPAPTGLVLECAEITVPIDTSGAIYGAATVGLMQARLTRTPSDAAPLVLTSGLDRASTATLVDMAVGAGSTALLAAHPIVAIDRRGIGTSAPTSCLPPDVRQGLVDNAQPAGAPVGPDPVAAVATLSEQATTACKDFLQPQELTFDAAHAADDIDALRQQWQVDRIGLMATGNGSLIAAAYAQKYGGHLARLMLDSPWPVGVGQSTLVEQQVQGREAALSAFAVRCAAVHCSLGADPRAAIMDLVHRAAAGQLPGISANALLTAITGFLGSPRAGLADRSTELADALSAAGRGATAAAGQLINHETAETATDGQFISECSDEQQRAPLAQARDLSTNWGTHYPVFGAAAAVAMVGCTSWPTVTPPAPPNKLNGLSVLVLHGAADPVAGNGALSGVTGMFDAAGAHTAAITWQGFGHLVFDQSPGCAAGPALTYLNDATLPVDGLACPA